MLFLVWCICRFFWRLTRHLYGASTSTCDRMKQSNNLPNSCNTFQCETIECNTYGAKQSHTIYKMLNSTGFRPLQCYPPPFGPILGWRLAGWRACWWLAKMRTVRLHFPTTYSCESPWLTSARASSSLLSFLFPNLFGKRPLLLHTPLLDHLPKQIAKWEIHFLEIQNDFTNIITKTI